MQHIAQPGNNMNSLENMAIQEAISFDGPQGTPLVMLTLDEYNRITDARLQEFKKAWHALSDEAERNGLTPQALAGILADAR